MPTFPHDYLEGLSAHVLRAAGASDDEARLVAERCVRANLVGHDSHGVIQIPTYVDRIGLGHVVPGAPMEVRDETPTTAVIDGHWGFGYVATTRAMEMAIAKARESRIAAMTVTRQGHVGRLAEYTQMAAREGMMGLMTADSGRGPKSVAPYGGRVPRLGTNPLCIALPSNLEGPFTLDMATSAVAEGKVSLARARGESIPPGWVVDAEGRSTTDPHALLQGGSLLPLGGDQGHKGYGLGAVIEILSGVLTGLGFGVSDGFHNDGCFLLVVDVSAFRPLEAFKQEVTEFAEYLTATPPASGFDRVYYPGEVEHLTAQQRRRTGVTLEDGTWERLQALVRDYGLEAQVGQP